MIYVKLLNIIGRYETNLRQLPTRFSQGRYHQMVIIFPYLYKSMIGTIFGWSGLFINQF